MKSGFRPCSLEARDREVLGDPETHILRGGGHVYFVELGGETVGCVALIAQAGKPGTYELSKMAVAPGCGGGELGRELLGHAIGEARRLGRGRCFWGVARNWRMRCICMRRWGFGMFRGSCCRSRMGGRMCLWRWCFSVPQGRRAGFRVGPWRLRSRRLRG